MQYRRRTPVPNTELVGDALGALALFVLLLAALHLPLFA